MPDPTAPAVEPVADPAGESGPAPLETGFDFEAAFSGPLDASKPVEAVADPPAEAPAGDSGPTDGEPSEPVASKPADQETEPAAPRRGKAIEAERHSWAEREAELRANWEAERQKAATAEQEMAAAQAKQQELLAQVASEVGPQAEFDRLNSLPSSGLTFEQQEQLDGWKAARATLAPRIEFAQQVARNNLNAGLLAEAARLAELPGIEAEAITKTGAGSQTPFEDLCRYFYDTATEQARGRVAELEAELTDLRTKRAGQAAPLASGGASPGLAPARNPNAFDPTQPLDEMWRESFALPVGRNGTR